LKKDYTDKNQHPEGYDAKADNGSGCLDIQTELGKKRKVVAA